jgi:cell division protein FtsW (lipid II flippase)
MKLNWRKIILIIVCAECLFIYWNSLSTMNFKKQRTTTHLAPAKQQQTPITQIQPQMKDTKRIDSDLHTKDKAS